ncbi:hypothetical protein [Marinicauda salina]|nr:hypothetical protein [Marinicauda salina]
MTREFTNWMDGLDRRERAGLATLVAIGAGVLLFVTGVQVGEAAARILG